MSTRIDGGTRGALVAEDDDWFATAQQQAVELDDLSWENEPEWQLQGPTPPDLGRRQGAIVLAVAVAAFLVFAGILIGRETKSSSTTVVTATSATQAEDTPAATGAGDNSAATSTPSTSTPSTSTPSTSTPSTSTPSTSTPSTSTPSTSTPNTSTPSTSTGTPSSTAVPTDATLRPGATGTAVIALQKALTTLGYVPGAADGTYGATTAQAVTAFQAAKSLTADGIAGAKTLAAINTALASG
jgi:murein L,D-transpeptidase YcbB/YkuD